jgi:hypothetical protein
MMMQAGNAGNSPDVNEPPLSMRLENLLNLANDTLGVARTIDGRTFGFPPTAAASADGAKLQAVRVSSVENTIYDLSHTLGELHGTLHGLNNRI